MATYLTELTCSASAAPEWTRSLWKLDKLGVHSVYTVGLRSGEISFQSAIARSWGAFLLGLVVSKTKELTHCIDLHYEDGRTVDFRVVFRWHDQDSWVKAGKSGISFHRKLRSFDSMKPGLVVSNWPNGAMLGSNGSDSQFVPSM